MGFLEIVAFCASTAIITAVIFLIRSGRLHERYALPWLLSSAVLLTLSLGRGLLDGLARSVGIYYPPSLLFLGGFVFLLLLLLHFSVVISDLKRRNRRLTQELGLLGVELQKLRKTVESGKSEADRAGQ